MATESIPRVLFGSSAHSRQKRARMGARKRLLTAGPLGMATLDGGFVGDAETRRNGIAGIARHRRSSPESEGGALPLINTDDTDQQKGAGKRSPEGRVPPPKAKTGLAGDPGRCHMRVAGTAIRKVVGVARS
jgi:hypothetical protein